MYLRVSENRLEEVSMNIEFTMLFQKVLSDALSLYIVSAAGGRYIWISEVLLYF